jgi:hypothetical protein
MSLLAETSALLGDTDSASVLYRLLVPWATLNVADVGEGIRGSVSRYLGILATMRKSWVEAEQHFEAAIAMNERMGARPWLAHTHSDFARMMVARDEPRDRRRALEVAARALEAYRSLGMDSFAAEAARLERELAAAHAR